MFYVTDAQEIRIVRLWKQTTYTTKQIADMIGVPVGVICWTVEAWKLQRGRIASLVHDADETDIDVRTDDTYRRDQLLFDDVPDPVEGLTGSDLTSCGSGWMPDTYMLHIPDRIKRDLDLM
jgi:hypothetical protein